MTVRNTAIRSSMIDDEAITEPKLDIVNSPTTDYILKWNGTKFEWTSVGVGDMLKSIYDTDDDGIVDKAETLTDGGSGNEVTYAEAQDAVDKAHTEVATFGITIDGSGEVFDTGYKGFIRVPVNATITKVTLLGDKVSGSIVIDLWKCSYANYDGGSTHPVDGDSITSATPPTISASNKSEDSTLTNWTTSISSGEIIGFNVDSISTFTKVTLTIEITKT